MKTINAILLLLCLSATAFAQTPQANVKKAAQKMCDHLLKKEYYKFAQMTYTKAMDKNEGGLTEMARFMGAQEQAMAANETFVVGAWPGDASAVIDTAGELQCTIPQHVKLKLKGGKNHTYKTLLFAISRDKGKTWQFLDLRDMTLTELRADFPTLSTKHNVPASQR